MDCVELRSDIDKLKQELQALKSGVERIRGAEERGGGLRNMVKPIDSGLLDTTLVRYLRFFQEQNSEFFSGFALGERIEIRDSVGTLARIISIAIIEDRRVLIGGRGGMLYSGFYNGRGGIRA